MKRRTANFIMKQNGEKTGIFARIDRKTLITIISITLGVLILGGLYLWYVRNYANARKVDLETDKALSYELQSVAADNGIVKDFLWSRTKELMLKNADDKTLIVEKVTLPGKLIDQEQSESGTYSLEDQALLLRIYVSDNNRIAAKSLYSEINKRFDIDSESVPSKVAYLEAFLYYYSSYGTKDDAEKLSALVSSLFDEQGLLKPESFEVSKYSGQAYVSSADENEALSTGSAMGDLEAGGTNGSYQGSDEKKTINGVLLSSIDLKLIKALETNEFLPEGSYERNLKIVKDSVLGSDLPLYAYAYEINDGEVGYVYSSGITGTVDLTQCVMTMRNLAEVDELSEASYSWLKSTLYGTERFADTYFIVTGRPDGNESVEAYFCIARIALIKGDDDVFGFCMQRLGAHVATLDSSPALSMIFRSEDGRNVVYAKDNLEMYLIIR